MFSPNAWGTFNTSKSEAGATNKFCMGPEPGCMPHMLWRAIALKECGSERLVFNWLRDTTSIWVRSALQQPQMCVWSRQISCSSCPQLHLKVLGLLPHGPGSSKVHTLQSVSRTGVCLQPFPALSFPLNAHWTSFPTRQTRPMCIHLSRTNDLKWRCSLAATITLTIYSAETNHESRAAFQIWKNF